MNFINKELKAWLLLLAWIVIGISPVVYAYASHERVEEDAWLEATEDVLRFDMEKVDVELEEVVIEPLEVEKTDSPKIFYLGEFRLTAYCPCKKCCGKDDGITASGTVATQGRTVAVDPSIIPYGTVLVINGHEYIAEDNGGKWIQGKEIDIYFDNHEEALEFGIQYAEVFTTAVQDD